MKSCVPNLSNETLAELEQDAKEFALSQGICARGIDLPNENCVQSLRMTLFPSPFPKKWCSLAQKIQKGINLMMHRIALDKQFLEESLIDVIQVDSFTRNLYEIYLKVQDDPKASKINLGLFRSDYMLNKDPEALLQVEVNAISVGFLGLSPSIAKLHRYIINKVDNKINHKEQEKNPCRFAASALAKAWDLYGKKDAIVIVVVEDKPNNICDQKTVEIELSLQRSDITVKRKRFIDIEEKCLDENNILRVDGKEVAVVYYRTGYSPSQYPNQKIWNIRLMLERSQAIKCPSIKYQLSGVKKFQQILTDKSILSKFVKPEEALDELYGTFAAMYLIKDTPEGNKHLENGIRNPNKFVLKPQREGGGNNYYGQDMANKLKEIRNSQERDAYILMELINATQTSNYGLDSRSSLKSQNFTPDDIISELGIYGSILADDQNVYHNSEDGLLLRSKKAHDNETGVACGTGFLDSPFLY